VCTAYDRIAILSCSNDELGGEALDIIHEKDIELLHNRVLELLGPATDWAKWPGGYQGRADLALLDAVYSIRQKYEVTVRPKVKIWEKHHPVPGVPELEYLANIDEAQIREVFGGNVLPGVRLNGLKTGKRKSMGIVEVAQRLCSQDVSLGSADLIRGAVTTRGADYVLNQVRKTKGVGPATANYFLMLLGIHGVKVDTLLVSWVRRNLEQTNLANEVIVGLVTKVAEERFNRSATDLDYAIWRHESTQRANKPKVS
jgi:hypothetical protein